MSADKKVITLIYCFDYIPRICMIRLPLTTLDTYKVMTISVIRQSTAYIEDILEVKCQYYHSHRYTTNDYIILLRSFN